MVDFATLTGSMHIALGDRYSGIFATGDEWAQRAIAAGIASGERVWRFPFDEDYDAALESTIADVKQCTLEGEADHILGARLLKRFIDDRPGSTWTFPRATARGGSERSRPT
jgi:leucyl aminopeptidase